MVIVKLTGGLGNQLFQYAHGRAVSIKNKTSLLLDTVWYKGRIDRSYMLENFNIQAKIASKLNNIRTKLFFPKNYILGDFQSEKYFENIKDIIRNEFTLKNKISDRNKEILEKIQSTNSISIHLRGGDYIRGKKSDFHGTCSREYYSKAIDKIKSEVDSPFFFIFTDDIPWAKEYIKFPEPNIFISDNKNEPYEEMILMSYCKHNIIANSTFSWWGAWLNNNLDKIVIAPRKWFNDNSINTENIIPESWTQI